ASGHAPLREPVEQQPLVLAEVSPQILQQDREPQRLALREIVLGELAPALALALRDLRPAVARQVDEAELAPIGHDAEEHELAGLAGRAAGAREPVPARE